jgi:hypothetical protein
MNNPLREGKAFRDAASNALANIWVTIWTTLSAGGLYMDDFIIGDWEVIPTSPNPNKLAIYPASRLAALWASIKLR